MKLSRIAVTNDIPDGRFSVISHGSGFIKFLVPNLRYEGTTTLPIEGKVTPSRMQSDSNMTAGTTFANMLPSNQVTGFRTTDTFDMRNLWTMSVFRLSETSIPAASSNDLIGFSHCEDHDQDSVWKSAHVVLSSDLGVTWTRPVPILTAQERQPKIGVPAYNTFLSRTLKPPNNSNSQCFIWKIIDNFRKKMLGLQTLEVNRARRKVLLYVLTKRCLMGGT